VEDDRKGRGDDDDAGSRPARKAGAAKPKAKTDGVWENKSLCLWYVCEQVRRP
jgi:hypothetical protein